MFFLIVINRRFLFGFSFFKKSIIFLSILNCKFSGFFFFQGRILFSLSDSYSGGCFLIKNYYIFFS